MVNVRSPAFSVTRFTDANARLARIGRHGLTLLLGSAPVPGLVVVIAVLLGASGALASPTRTRI